VYRPLVKLSPVSVSDKNAAGIIRLGTAHLRDWGVILSHAAPNCEAEAAGLEPGDVVLSIDGKPMRESRDLALAVFRRVPGDELKMEIQRGKQRMSRTVAVLDRKNEPSQLEDLANESAALVRQLGFWR
jgi:serine protease Do